MRRWKRPRQWPGSSRAAGDVLLKTARSVAGIAMCYHWRGPRASIRRRGVPTARSTSSAAHPRNGRRTNTATRRVALAPLPGAWSGRSGRHADCPNRWPDASLSKPAPPKRQPENIGSKVNAGKISPSLDVELPGRAQASSLRPHTSTRKTPSPAQPTRRSGRVAGRNASAVARRVTSPSSRTSPPDRSAPRRTAG